MPQARSIGTRSFTLSLELTLEAGAQAELLITDFLVEANVLGHSTDPDGARRPLAPIVPRYITDTGYRRRAMEKSDDHRLGLPWVLTSQIDLNVCNDGRYPCDVPAGYVAATQTKTGWFKSQAVLHHGFFPDYQPDDDTTTGCHVDRLSARLISAYFSRAKPFRSPRLRLST